VIIYSFRRWHWRLFICLCSFNFNWRKS